MRTLVMLTTLSVCLTITAAHSQSSPFGNMTRFGGTVVGVNGSTLTVTSAESGNTSLRLTPATVIMVRKPASVADIHGTSFLGCTAVEQPGGALNASECHIFPESMRGLGEGHNPMGPPATTMTNGSVTTMTNGNVQGAAAADGSTVLTVSYKGGAQQIRVTSKTVVTLVERGDKDLLKPGAKITGGARLAADGTADAVLLNLTP